MPRFFTQSINRESGLILGEDAKHIAKVLRMKQGESIIACDTKGTDYQCIVERVEDSQVLLKVQKVYPSDTEPTVLVKLYQALPKSDKMELIVQKAVELGVYQIIPVQTHRCVSRPDKKAMEKKLERYNRIALEAAKQCGRGIIPQVLELQDFEEAVKEISNETFKDNCKIIFYERSTNSLQKVLSDIANSVGTSPTQPQQTISIMVGAEGGFEEKEVQLAQKHGLEVLSLGARILRCETAPLAALAAIMYQTGNL